MPSTAATLEILVNARTSSATSSLRRMDTSARTSATHLSNLDRTSGRLTTTLGRAGRAAVGAATAYIGLSAAKTAITTTSDLAKTTLALNKNMGFTVKTASELAANLKIRGSDAKASSQAFATFAGVLKQAASGSASATQHFTDLGIKGKQLKTDLKDPQQALFDVADGLKNVGSGITRTDAQRKLFGRGWQALSPILRGGAADLQKNLDLADQMGASFSNLGIHNMKDFIDAQHQAQLGMLGLQIGFTQTLGPVLIGAMNQFSNLAKSIHQNGFVNAISDAITGAANRAAQMAPKVLEAFAQGFLHAGLGGQLALSGILLAKFGGLSAFAKFGKGAGRTWGLAFMAGVLGVELVKQIIQIIHGSPLQAPKPEQLSTQLHQKLPNISIGSPTIGRQGVTLNTQLGKIIFNPDTEKVIKVSTDKLKTLVGKSADEVTAYLTQKFGGGQSGKQSAAVTWGRQLDALQGVTHSKLGKLLGLTKTDIDTMRSAVSQGMDWKSVVSGRMDAWINTMVTKFGGAQNITGKNLQTITNLVNNELRFFGVSPTTIDSSGQAHGVYISQPGKAQSKQAGGLISVPGIGSGDKVPAMLEPGEVVWNKKLVAAMGGPGALAAANDIIPRFAKGGGFLPRYSASPGTGAMGSLAAGGLNATDAALDQFLRRAQAQSRQATPGSGPRASMGPSGHGSFMGVPMANWVIQSLQFAAGKGASPQPTAGWAPGTGHAPGSQHYLSHYPGGAVDYGWPVDLPALAKKMSVVNATRNFKWPLLAPIGFRDDGHASGTGHQRGGLIRLATGGDPLAAYNKAYPRGGGPAIPFNVAAAIAEKAGLPGITMAQIAIGESTLHPGAVSPDGGFGLWQMTPSVQSSGTVNAWNAIGSYFNPFNNAKMAKLLGQPNAGTYHGSSNVKGWNLHYSGPLMRGGTTTAATPKKKRKKGSTSGDGGSLGVDQGVQDITQAYFDALQTAVDSENMRRHAINDLYTSANAETLARYQVGASQSGVLGLSAPALGSLYSTLWNDLPDAPTGPDLSGVTDLADINAAAINAIYYAAGLTPPGPYSGAITGAGLVPLGSGLFDQFASTGHFAHGGIVPGPVGKAQRAIVHGGERITPPGQEGDTHVHFYIDGKEIQGITRREMKRSSRRGRRKLPSAGA